METSQLLKKVRKIELKTRGVYSHLFSGEYQSAFKGRGMTFSENREYEPGDEIRMIDWNVSARLNHTYVKVFEEERELNVILMIDGSASSMFGAFGLWKNELITEISALLAFSAISNNDKVGVIFFTDKIEKFIPPKKGRTHTLRIIREMVNFSPASSRTNLNFAFRFLNNVVKKRSVVFILSDFIADQYEHSLSATARKHDVMGLHIYDEREQQLPNVGLIHSVDAETGKSLWVDSSSVKVRAAYAKQFNSKLGYFKTSFRKSNADSISISTTDNYIKSLMMLFEKRVKKV